MDEPGDGIDTSMSRDGWCKTFMGSDATHEQLMMMAMSQVLRTEAASETGSPELKKMMLGLSDCMCKVIDEEERS